MKLFRSFLFVVTFLLISTCSFSQPPTDPNGGGDPDVPLGGIELLIAAGAAFGAKKLLRKPKE